MSDATVSRRRFISIAAAAGGTVALTAVAGARAPRSFTWKGVALGAEASLTLEHSDEAVAKTAIEACLAEVSRLEAIFSLHRADSALARLNRDGALEAAPADLRVLLAEALDLAAASDGAFDPTVQPLWELYARHFADQDADASGPRPDAVSQTLALIGWRNVAIDGGRISLRKRGMALTLNGIAQGYITDKVGDLLRALGFAHVLVNMGEHLALGPKWDGADWTVGIADPASPHTVFETVRLERGAVATSGSYRCSFDGAGRLGHILDPRTGVPARAASSVTVVANRATLADGLSTALSVVDASHWPRLLIGKDARVFRVPLGHETGAWL